MSDIHNITPEQTDEATTVGVTYVRYVKTSSPSADEALNSSIMMIDERTPGKVLIKWAEGSMAFTYQWSLRASYTYTSLRRG